MLLPSFAAAGRGQILTPQYINIPPAAAAATPALLPSHPLLFSIPPSSFPFPILPTMPPTTVFGTSPQQSSNLAGPSVSHPQRIRPTTFGQADLEVLTNIQNRIKSRLSSMSSDEEVSESSMTSSLSPSYSMHTVQSLGPDLVLVSPSPVARPCRCCVVRGPEILNSTSEYMASLNRALSESEIVIDRIDTHSRSTAGSRQSTGTGVGVVTAMATPTATASLSTVVKFTNTTPRLSLAQGSEGRGPSAANPLSPLLAIRPPLNPALSPLTISNFQPPAVICAPPPLPPSYFILPSSPLAATNLVGGASIGSAPSLNTCVLMGGLNSPQFLMTGAGGSYPPGLCIMVSNALPMITSVNSAAASPTGAGVVVCSSLPLPITSTMPLSAVTAHQGRGELCGGGDSKSGSKKSRTGKTGTSIGAKTASRKRPGDTESIPADTKVLKLSTTGASKRTTSKSILPQHIRDVTTNQNHPRWSGDDTATAGAGEEEPQGENGTTQSERRQHSKNCVCMQSLLGVKGRLQAHLYRR